jgi:hypothetical protein
MEEIESLLLDKFSRWQLLEEVRARTADEASS